jgi:hypothetical protein
MAARELQLNIDIETGRIVNDFLSTVQAQIPRFVFGDSVPSSVRLLRARPGDGDRPWDDVDPTGKVVRVAIGNPAGAPTAGTFTITYGGDTTTAISHAADGATIQTALNALASITSAGGVTVTKSGSAIRIIFNTAGTRTAITSDASALYPSSAAEVRVAATGSGSIREVVLVRLETTPAAFAELGDDLPEADVTITEIRAGSGSVGAINLIEFSPIPYAGTYTLEIDSDQTLGVPWNADAETLQAAIEILDSVGSGNVQVSGDFPRFTLSFDVSLGDIGEITADLSALLFPVGRAGAINTHTAGMIELLNGSATANAKLEVELYDTDDDSTWTVLQTDCIVIEDVIGNDPASVPAFPSLISALAPGDAVPVNAITVSETLTITGIETPGGANPTVISRGADINGFPSWGSSGIGNWRVFNNGVGAWEIYQTNGFITYSATKTSAALTPIGLTGWTLGDDAVDQPAITGSALVDETPAPPYLRAVGSLGYIKTADGWMQFDLDPLA